MAPQLFSFSHLIIPYKMSSAKTEQLFISAVQSSPVQQQQQQQQQQQSASQQSSPSQRGGAVRESTAASATQSAAPEPPRVVGVTLVQQQQEQRPLPPRIVGATLLERSSEPAPCRVVGATLVQQPSSTVSAQEPFSAVNLKEIVLVENNKKETNRIVNELINISSSSDSNNKIISIDDKLKLKTNTTSSNDSYDDENNKLNSVHISNTQEAESINNSVSNSNRAVSSVQGALVEAPDNKASGCRLRGGGGGSTSSSSSPPPAAASGSIKTTPSPAAKVVSSAATPTTALVQANNKSASGGSASAATNNATMAAVVAVQRTNTKPCCFCWCCCCTCSWKKCLAVKSGDELNSKNKEANYLESLSCDGEPPPTLEDIRSWGHSFDKLMKSAAGRKVFRDFLKCEYSEENILFWLACEELKRESNPEVVEEKARFIYEDYISILSPKEVSLDSRVREIVNKNMVDPTPHTFDEAQLQIYTLMHRDSYPRFINSHIFKRLAQLNNNSVVAPPACSTAAAGSSSSPQGGSSSHQQPSSSRKQSIA